MNPLLLVPLVAVALTVPAVALNADRAPAAAAVGTAAAPAVTPDPGHVRTLTAVLDNITAHYPTFAQDSPGAPDVLGYGLGDLWRKGIDGTGTTVAVIEGWDDPGVGAALDRFDQRYGLPPADIQTIYPNGPLPAQCPAGMVALGSYGSCNAWAGELRLDVESVHLIAPYAKILITATPADSEIADDQAAQVAMPELMKAVEYVAQHHLADAMSISDGTGESTEPAGRAEILAHDPGPLTAAAAGVPVTVATGDCGVVQNLAVAASQCGNTTKGPDTAIWDDSPWVTAVGGSVPNLDPKTGARVGPDPVWHEGKFSEGAGYSEVYGKPAYQRVDTGSRMRSVPDITMDGSDGTSEAAPEFAAVLALAAQLNRGPVASVNDALYKIGPQGARAGIADVVSGDNSVTSGSTVLVPGFTAGRGFDVATGWGTVQAGAFVPALVAASRTEHGPGTSQAQAAAALSGLEHGAQLSTGTVPAGGTTYLTATGFLPQHPVALAVDGKPIATLTANPLGAITYSLNPAAAAIPAGHHTLTLTSLLLTQTTPLTTR
jgi:subtilase family serine protease